MELITQGGNQELTIPRGQKIGINCSTGTAIVYFSSDPYSPSNFYEETRITKNTNTLGTFDSDKIIRIDALDGDVVYDIGFNPYVVSVQDLKWKQSVRLATIQGGSLESTFEAGDSVDNIVLNAGDRILIKDQVSGSENGIYIVQTSGAPIRAEDANTGDKIVSCVVRVEEGTTNKGLFFSCENTFIELEVTNIVFVTGLAAVVHNSLLGLQGGAVNEYYHLPLSTYTFANDMDQNVASDSSPTFSSLDVYPGVSGTDAITNIRMGSANGGANKSIVNYRNSSNTIIFFTEFNNVTSKFVIGSDQVTDVISFDRVTTKVDYNADVNVVPGKVFRVGGTQVITQRQSAITSMTDNTTGIVSNTLVQYDGKTEEDVDNNFASLNAKVDEILVILRTHGLIAT